MKRSMKLLSLAVSVALAQVAGQAFATPTVGSGLTEITANNWEEIFRPTDSCSASNPCLTNDQDLADNNDAFNYFAGVTSAPTNWSIPDPFTGAANVISGDVFVGLIDYQQISNTSDGNFWEASGTDRLMGYFATEVDNVYLAPNDPYDAAQTNLAHIDFTAASTDPYGILSGNALLAWYVDLTTAWTSVQDRDTQIANATSGTLWATFGVGADSDGSNLDLDGFLYSHVPLGAAPADFSGEAWLAMNFLTNNTGYDWGRTLNDVNESELGGTTAPPSALTCDALNATCTDLIQTFTLEVYNNGWITSTNSGRWGYSSGDDAFLNRTVPLPGTLALLGLGLVGVRLASRKMIAQ